MKKFKLKADCTFTADDIEDALLKLAEHFRKLVEDDDYEGSLFNSGEVSVERIEEK